MDLTYNPYAHADQGSACPLHFGPSGTYLEERHHQTRVDFTAVLQAQDTTWCFGDRVCLYGDAHSFQILDSSNMAVRLPCCHENSPHSLHQGSIIASSTETIEFAIRSLNDLRHIHYPSQPIGQSGESGYHSHEVSPLERLRELSGIFDGSDNVGGSAVEGVTRTPSLDLSYSNPEYGSGLYDFTGVEREVEMPSIRENELEPVDLRMPSDPSCNFPPYDTQHIPHSPVVLHEGNDDQLIDLSVGGSGKASSNFSTPVTRTDLLLGVDLSRGGLSSRKFITRFWSKHRKVRRRILAGTEKHSQGRCNSLLPFKKRKFSNLI